MRNEDGVHFEKCKVKLTKKISVPPMSILRTTTITFTITIFRKLNDRTVKDLFSLRSISQCIDQLSGNKYFSTLDMASGYWQIEINEKDRHKTAFITKHGLFEHKQMAFGLCNAAATFQRVIQFVLHRLTYILAFLDDVIILGKDFEAFETCHWSRPVSSTG